MSMWQEARAHPILFAVYIVWIINASFNANMGHTIGGAGLSGLLLGGVFVAIAFLGAYAADAQQQKTGGERVCLWLMVIFQLVIGQVAGWQSIGFALDRGAEMLGSQAASRDVDKTALKAKRDELKAIGLVRPVASIQADEKLECARKSRAYPTGEGPACTAFRKELGSAERARTLEAEINGLTAKLKSGPKVGDAETGTAVPAALASAVASFVVGSPVVVTGDQVRFGIQVFLVGVLEYIATLGKWLFGAGTVGVRHGGRGYGGDAAAASAGRSSGPPPPSAPAHMFDPRMLPPAWRMHRPQIAPANDGFSDAGSAHGGGAVNVINVGPSAGPPALVPPRVAARRRM